MKKISYEKWCTAFIKNLGSYFNLAGWGFAIEFLDEHKEDSEGCFASVCTNSAYMKASFRLYPLLKKDFDDGDIDHVSEVLTHEFSHILIDPLHEHMHPFLSEKSSPAFMRDLENVTQRIAMVIVQSLPKNLIPPR